MSEMPEEVPVEGGSENPYPMDEAVPQDRFDDEED